MEVWASKSLHRPGIYKFLWGGNVNCQNLPPAGSDFALRATQGQSQLLAVPITSPKTLCVEEQGQSCLLEPHTSSPKTLCVEEKGLRFTQAFELVL